MPTDEINTGLTSDHDGWLQLSSAFADRQFFFCPPIVDDQSSHAIKIRISRFAHIWHITSYLLFAGICAAALIVILFIDVKLPRPGVAPNARRERLVIVAAPILTSVSLVLGVVAALQRRTIYVNQAEGTVRFEWGYVPLLKSLTFPATDVEAFLKRKVGAKAGYVAFGMSHKQAGLRIELLVTRWREQAEPVFLRLNALLDGTGSDSTLSANTPVTEGIARTPIRLTMNRYRSRRLSINDGQATLRDSFLETLGLLIISVMVIGFTLGLGLAFGLPLGTFAIVIALSLLIGCLALYTWPRTYVLRKQGWITLPRRGVEGDAARQVHASEIAAIQIVTATGDGEHIPIIYMQRRDFRVYQVNLVLREGVRVNLFIDTDLSRAQEDAQRLAKLLEVQLLNHL